MVPAKSIEKVTMDKSLVDLVLMVLYAWGIYAAVVSMAANIPMVDIVIGGKNTESFSFLSPFSYYYTTTKTIPTQPKY